MNRRSLIAALLLIPLGCTDHPSEQSSAEAIEPGTYSGLFYFTEKGDTTVGGVQFTFTDTLYTCIPQIYLHPPAGGGSFTLHEDSVRLRDLITHTANFDWTLILNGGFGYRRSGGMIILTQNDSAAKRTRRIELTTPK